ncbi:MAG: hypothetical protein AABY30_01310 [Candidatus Thermoplasmatota archaeon]
MGLRERWRSGRPAFVVLAGAAIGLGGNAAWIAWQLLAGTAGPGPLAASAVGIAASVATPFPLHGGRTTLRFVLSGLAASLVAVLTWPGVVGGGVALAGAVWGILDTLGRL